MATVDQTTVQWQALPERYENHVEDFRNGPVLFGMEKSWFTRRFLTGVELKIIENRVRLMIYGKTINAQSFGLGILEKNDKGRFEITNAWDQFELDGKTPGLASNNLEYKVEKKDRLIVLTQKKNENSTFPFFDTTSMTYDTKSPLGGIGVFYYTNDVKHAGFIRPYLVPLDYKSFLEDMAEDQDTDSWYMKTAKKEKLSDVNIQVEEI